MEGASMRRTLLVLLLSSLLVAATAVESTSRSSSSSAAVRPSSTSSSISSTSLSSSSSSSTSPSSSSSSSQQESSSTSAAGTILSFVVALPNRWRSLLVSTCGEAALPKDAEVEAIDGWLFSLADFLSLPRVACTAMGLQITQGAPSFTVFCLGSSEQLSAFTPGAIIAGATVSSGMTTTEVMRFADITFDDGSQLVLEGSLDTLVPAGFPSAVVDCVITTSAAAAEQFLAVQAVAAFGDDKRRRRRRSRALLADIPAALEEDIETAVTAVLGELATESGLDPSSITAVGGNQVGESFSVFFTVFFKASPAQAASLTDATSWGQISGAIGWGSDFGFPTPVSEQDFPDLTATLLDNLKLDVPASVTQAIKDANNELNLGP